MATQEVLSQIETLRGQIRALEQDVQPVSAESGAYPVWSTVLLARRQDRPKPQEIVAHLIPDLLEFHGDRFAGDDQAILGGVGTFDGQAVTVIATRRGNTLQTNMLYNFGMPHPEGYRKALRLIAQAAKFHRPVLLFVDTPGAYPGVDSEDHGISEAIAKCLYELSGTPVPMITTITGEGGSGGALALSVADRILMMENAIFSVISPEGCASILFKDSTQAPKAAQSLKLDARNLLDMGLVDQVINEGSGLHLQPQVGLDALKAAISRQLKELSSTPTNVLLENRYRKFRTIGRILENQ